MPAGSAAADAPGLDPLNTGAVLEVIGALLAVLALIAVLAMALRRFGKVAPRSGRVLQVIDAISIGARDRIVLVDVGGARVLLGVTPGSIRTLHVGGQADGEPSEHDIEGLAAPEQRGFAQHVRAALGGGTR
ncbi:MAG: flagellar biosynthetic protein FliO [Gammaproteobacteria bacterium]|nr:flagellar biosynthetic protein FliO [Gammaproteobacteria bacterium]